MLNVDRGENNITLGQEIQVAAVKAFGDVVDPATSPVEALAQAILRTVEMARSAGGLPSEQCSVVSKKEERLA